MNLVRGHCQAGSLTGAVASKRVTEALKGQLSTARKMLKLGMSVEEISEITELTKEEIRLCVYTQGHGFRPC